jgi:hypothetical protein
LRADRSSAVFRLAVAQREVREAQARIESLKLAAAREIGQSLGLAVDFAAVNRLDGPRTGKRPRIDWEGIMADLPDPCPMPEAVAMICERDGTTNKAARQRIYRLIQSGRLVRKGVKLTKSSL